MTVTPAAIYGRPFVVAICPVGLSVLFVCPVCIVSILWPNGWMDQDATWYGARPRPKPHCVRWGPSSPTERDTSAPTFRPISIVAERSPISTAAELL